MGAETFDVVVVGGGVTGSGVALDAAARGLSVALLEARDLASGTSSRSGKTFHGGLRYLEQRNFKLVREAAHERNLSLRLLCPHLARPMPFLFPLTHRGWERLYMGVGVALYDALGGAHGGVPRHRHLSRRRVLREFPSLRPDRVKGGLQYYDALFDDARHTATVARTAANLGAAIVTRAEVVGMLRDGGRVTGVRARDAETGAELEVRGRCVISATGAWADRVQQLTGESQVEVAPAKGVHILVPADRIQAEGAFIARTADSILSIRPWGRHWLIGTTDTPWAHDREAPVANAQDIDYLLEVTNSWLKVPLTAQDIVGVYTGVRPLVSGKVGAADQTAALSRDHAILPGPEGLFTIVGGKYTTYRKMAEDAVDLAAKYLGGDIPGSITGSLPLAGADGYAALRNRRAALAASSGLTLEQVDHLLGRYGSLIGELFAELEARPELAATLPAAPDYLEVEARYAASHEGALHLEDALSRRMRITIETRDRGLSAAPRVAELMGEVLGWDEARRASEVAAYTARVEADRRAEAEPTDDAAFAASTLAPAVA
jgi:glycerol-3-phosphate dehydrogenase